MADLSDLYIKNNRPLSQMRIIVQFRAVLGRSSQTDADVIRRDRETAPYPTLPSRAASDRIAADGRLPVFPLTRRPSTNRGPLCRNAL